MALGRQSCRGRQEIRMLSIRVSWEAACPKWEKFDVALSSFSSLESQIETLRDTKTDPTPVRDIRVSLNNWISYTKVDASFSIEKLAFSLADMLTRCSAAMERNEKRHAKLDRIQAVALKALAIYSPTAIPTKVVRHHEEVAIWVKDSNESYTFYLREDPTAELGVETYVEYDLD